MDKSESATSSKFFKRLKLKSSFLEKEITLATMIILVLNILDGVLTSWGIQRGLIEEGNPLMQLLLSKSSMSLIMTIKILIIIILVTACWRTRNSSPRLVSYGLRIVMIAYLVVMIMHIAWIYPLIIF